MATAKKPVVKRAASKKPAGVKPVVTGAAKPRGRRPKTTPETEVNEPVVGNQTQAGDSQKGVDTQGQKEQNARDILEITEIIDLRNASVNDRFAVVNVLAQEGYVFSTALEDDPMNSWMTYLSVEALRLGNNKILYAATEAEIKDSYEITRPVVDHKNHRVGFTLPTPYHPTVLEFGEAKYLRVG